MTDWLDRKRRSNQERINMVGSSVVPLREEMPLGIVVEVEPEWVFCCCDQDIPRPSGGFSTPVGSFCSECFVRLIEHLFNGTKPMFLNAIRDETEDFIGELRDALDSGAVAMPNPVATTLKGVARGQVRRFLDKIGRNDDEEC